jgi:hypothetical protein
MALDQAAAPPALMLPPRLGVLRRPAGDSAAAIRRLVVPVPLADFDEALFGRLVWELAEAADVDVLLLAMVDGKGEDLLVRRRLIMLAAILRRPHSTVETAIERERTWIRALRRVVQEGDLVVCPSDERAVIGKKPGSLADQVVTDLRLPAYLLDELPLDPEPRRGFHPRSLLAWAAPLAVLAVFGGVQVQIVIQTLGWLQALLLATTVGLELASLLAVESLAAPWR